MAAKAKTAFFCRNCGFESPKWQGKCPSCAEWNTFTEEVIERPDDKEVWKDEKPDKKGNFPLALDEIAAGDYLMGVKNNYFWLGEDSPVGFIANGDTLKITRVQSFEDRFGFTVDDDEIEGSTFATVGSLVEFVDLKLAS